MKKISELNKGDKVLVYNIDENTYFYSTIKDIDVKSSKIFFEGYSICYNRQIKVFEEKEEIYQRFLPKNKPLVEDVFSRPSEFFDWATETSDVFRKNRW